MDEVAWDEQSNIAGQLEDNKNIHSSLPNGKNDCFVDSSGEAGPFAAFERAGELNKAKEVWWMGGFVGFVSCCCAVMGWWASQCSAKKSEPNQTTNPIIQSNNSMKPNESIIDLFEWNWREEREWTNKTLPWIDWRMESNLFWWNGAINGEEFVFVNGAPRPAGRGKPREKKDSNPSIHQFKKEELVELIGIAFLFLRRGRGGSAKETFHFSSRNGGGPSLFFLRLSRAAFFQLNFI